MSSHGAFDAEGLSHLPPDDPCNIRKTRPPLPKGPRKMTAPDIENKWTQEELDQWFDTLVDFQQAHILKVLTAAASGGDNVLRLCNLIREEMEEKGLVILQSQANYDMFTAIFNGFQDGIIQWRLFSGNISTKNIFF